MTKHDHNWSPAEALLSHVQELERLEDLRKQAAENVKDGFKRATMDGFDGQTLKVVLELRKLPLAAVAERRALENTYLVALGMLTESLSEESRRRLDEEQRRQRGEEACIRTQERRLPRRGGSIVTSNSQVQEIKPAEEWRVIPSHPSYDGIEPGQGAPLRGWER